MEDLSQLTKLHLVSRSDMINASTCINLKTPTLSQIESKTPLTPLIYSLENPESKAMLMNMPEKSSIDSLLHTW